MSEVTNGYHAKLLRWLSELGVVYEAEYEVGPFSVDIFLPEMNRFVEVDGPFLHHTARANREREGRIRELEPDRDFVRVRVGTPKDKALAAIFHGYDG